MRTDRAIVSCDLADCEVSIEEDLGEWRGYTPSLKLPAGWIRAGVLETEAEDEEEESSLVTGRYYCSFAHFAQDVMRISLERAGGA